jgi:probable phosphoglycerate mutase
MWVAGRADNVDAQYVLDNPLGNTGVIVVEGDLVRGWHVDSWTDRIVGGLEVDSADGPGGEPYDAARR